MIVKKSMSGRWQVQQTSWVASLTLLLEVLATFFWYLLFFKIRINFPGSVILCSIIRAVYTGPVSVFILVRIRIRATDLRILLGNRILLFSSLAFKTPTKNKLTVFCWLPTYFLKVHFHHSSKIKSHEEVKKKLKSSFFLTFFRNDGMIRFRTNNDGFGRPKNIRILRVGSWSTTLVRNWFTVFVSLLSLGWFFSNTCGFNHCCGSMTFWGGSGSRSADPCLWLMDPDPGSGSCYFRHWPSMYQQKTNLLTQFFLLITFWSYIYIIFQR